MIQDLTRYKNKYKDDVVANMFLPAAVVMIFTQLTGVIANIIDGVITSRFLGPDAYSAVSLLGPIVNIILLFASFISIGGQVVCSNKIGTGDRDEANAVFTFSVLFGMGVAAFFIILGLLSPQILFRVCGVTLNKTPGLYDHMLHYFHGYLIGIPAVILVQVLSPFMVMDSGKKLVTVSATVLCITDIAGDLLNAFVFHGGIFGMGLATAVSVWLQLCVLQLHYIGKKGYFRFALKSFKLSHLKDITGNGSITFVRRLAVIIRDIATNRINLIIAVSTAAVAAKGIQTDLNMLMFCISIGIGRTILAISSMYYGASDKEGLKRVFDYAMLICTQISFATGVILFAAAPFISRIYTNDPDVIALSVFSIRCMAAGLIPDGLTEVYQQYLQGIQNKKLVNILCFTERLFVPLISALVLGMLFGSKGIMASVAVGKLVLILGVFVVLCIRKRGIPNKPEDYMALPEGFGGAAGDNQDARIKTMEDVIAESGRAREFCLGHNVGERGSDLMALFVEEMAGNIVKHGKPRGRSGFCVDYRLYADNGRICLSLRDYCEAFDPMRYYEINREDKSGRNMGIRMVTKLAEDVRYINAFNSNCLMIYMDAQDGI